MLKLKHQDLFLDRCFSGHQLRKLKKKWHRDIICYENMALDCLILASFSSNLIKPISSNLFTFI